MRINKNKERIYMNLKSVLNGIEGLKAKGNLDIDITNIAHDSRKVKAGGIFVAIKGFETDGHKYIKNAIERSSLLIELQKKVVELEDANKKLEAYSSGLEDLGLSPFRLTV